MLSLDMGQEIFGCAKLRRNVISPRKLRMVVDLVRMKNVQDAICILDLNKKKCAQIVKKLLLSAVSNWETKVMNGNCNNQNSDGLVISKIYVNGAGSLRRFRPAARGCGCRILRRTSNVYVEVS